jgi:hypothetical protein
MHYEVELNELAYEGDGAGGLRVVGAAWKPMRVLGTDMSVTPLRFAALGAARAYVSGVSREGVRIVQVADDGERRVVEMIGVETSSLSRMDARSRGWP